jgi:hypothetical protein
VEAEVGVGGDFGPRVHLGSRSAVTVWLHPNFHVYDAYPIAQRHCSRWGFFASPGSNWSISASSSRYLDYTCVRRRPHLAYPHYRRSGTINTRRGNYSRGPVKNRRYDKSYPNYPRRVITPKPLPRVKAPVRRRGTFGRTYNPPQGRRATVERGKPWEHNSRKGGVVTAPTRKKVVVERGKPWEHKANKGGVKSRYKSVKTVQKRSTLKTSRPKIIKEKRVQKKTVTKYKSKPRAGRKYSDLKSKKSAPRRGTLSL